MKYLIAIAAAATLFGQQPQPASPKPAHEFAGDDIRGYSDTPQITGQKWKVHDLERPRPVKVTPGPLVTAAPPADAIVLFDGKDLSQWVQAGRGGVISEPKWKVENGNIEILPRTGRLKTKQEFGDCQLHVEWQIPLEAKGNGQSIGNSGIEFMGRYEIQVLESSEHLTYADGGAGAIYGVWPPLVNPARPQGEWNVYDISFEAPRFEGDKLVKPAVITVFFNGVLVQNHKEFLGTTIWRSIGTYKAHPAEQSLTLQDHNQPVRYRNIWIRRVNAAN
ncbi:MAG: DUF1080 domain-containing protein [Desulfobacterales bacterium]|nr:DUF1080 domain-containing protein [Desulfobacterales bacterium]